VKKLEGLLGDLKALQAGEGKVKIDEGNEECFCQGEQHYLVDTRCLVNSILTRTARNHTISTYTPHCPHCGLVLCSLHKPHHPCPSCHNTLHTPAQLARLINRVQGEIDDRLALELAEREDQERARLDRLAAESVFPVLASGNSTPVSQPQSDGGRKVLTIAGGGGGGGGKGKGKSRSTATLTTTYTRPSPNPTRPPTPPAEDIVPRPPSSPLDSMRTEKELNKVLSWRENEDRPWGDMKGVRQGGWVYSERVVLELMEEDKVGRRKRKKDEKGLGVDGKKVVGAA